MATIKMGGYEFDQDIFHNTLKPQLIDYLKTHMQNKQMDWDKMNNKFDLNCVQDELVIVPRKRNMEQIRTGVKLNKALKDLGYIEVQE